MNQPTPTSENPLEKRLQVFHFIFPLDEAELFFVSISTDLEQALATARAFLNAKSNHYVRFVESPELVQTYCEQTEDYLESVVPLVPNTEIWYYNAHAD